MTLLQTLELTYPIIQAPMAGATTPKLAATTVSNFGGLGSLGAGIQLGTQVIDTANHPF